MLKGKKVKIRYLLVIGISIIFTFSVVPLILISVYSLRSLGGYSNSIGGRAIKNGSKLLFLERVKGKADQYSTVFKDAEKYVDILHSRISSTIKNISYYKLSNENTIKQQYGVWYWYWGDEDSISGRSLKQVEYFSKYFGILNDLGNQNKFFSSAWFSYVPGKLLFNYSKYKLHYNANFESIKKMIINFDYKADRWTPNYTSISGRTETSFFKKIYDSNGKLLGLAGINLDIDSIKTDSVNTLFEDIMHESKPSNGSINSFYREKEFKPFTFILDNNLNIINFPKRLYDAFGVCRKCNRLHADFMGDSSNIHMNLRQSLGIIEKLKTSKSGSEIIKLSGDVNYLVTFSKIQSNGWIYGVVQPESNILTPVYRASYEVDVITRDLIIALVLLGMIFFVIAVFIVLILFKEYLMKPIYTLIRGVNDVVRNGFLGCLYIRGAPEIVDLATTFNLMTEDLNNYMKNLKHEIQGREKVEGEMRTARQIQEALLPRITEIYLNKDFDIDAASLPAETVAGDFYDYFFISQNRFVFLVGDVSGKGVSSAFYMTIVRSIVRDCCLEEPNDPAKAVNHINKVLFQEYKADMLFVSLVLIYFDVNSGKGLYVNAGHPDVILINENGVCGELQKHRGIILSLVEDFDYQSTDFQLDFGESVVLYTDGILQPYNDNMTEFKTELLRQLNTYYELPIKEFTKKVVSSVDKEAENKREDDFTLLVFKRVKGGISKVR